LYGFDGCIINNCKRKWTEPANMVRPCSENGRRKITQNSIEMDTETKESMRKTEEKTGCKV
jgi:hypothetical protein